MNSDYYLTEFTVSEGVAPLRASLYQQDGIVELLNHVEGENLIMVEIGSWIGESANLFSKNSKISTIYCVDPWENFEKEEANFDLNMTPKMRKIKKTSQEASKQFEDKFFDLIYIDARHGYESIRADIEFWLPKTKKYIAGHDYNKKFVAVINAVEEKFGRPRYTFCDGSWLVDLDFTNKGRKYLPKITS